MLNQFLLFAEDKPVQPLEKTYQMPYSLTDTADSVDNAYYVVYWINVFFLVFNTALMLWFVLKYRRKTPNQPAQSEVTHSTKLEIFWTVIPTIIVIILGFWGVVQYLDMTTPPKNCVEIDVTGQKWNWTFRYNQGKAAGLSDGELHVVKGVPTRLRMTSVDVTHSLFIPVVRQKKDCIQGRYTYVWFNAKHAGNFDLFCTEYCGKQHSEMVARFVVHDTQADFDKWVEELFKKELTEDPVVFGERTFKNKCSSCHSLDGRTNTGPTLLNLYGRTEKVTDREKGAMDIHLTDDGKEPVFSNYVRESMMDPNAKIVTGFPAAMPTFKGVLRESQIRGIIEFLKWKDQKDKRPVWVKPTQDSLNKTEPGKDKPPATPPSK